MEVAAVRAAQRPQTGLARIGVVPCFGHDRLLIRRPDPAEDGERAGRAREAAEPGPVAVHHGVGGGDEPAVGRPVRARVRLGPKLEQMGSVGVHGVQDGTVLRRVPPAEDDPAIGRRAEGPSTDGKQRREDQGEDHARDREHLPRRAHRNSREPHRRGSHRETSQRRPPGGPLPTVRDVIEDRLELTIDDVPIGKAIERCAEGTFEIRRGTHARCSALNDGIRASASSEALNAVRDRFSRDFIVPSGTPSVAAASVSGRSR